MRNYKRYCSDIESVENYEKAKADNFVGWNVHHRLETHNSDGERRLVDINMEELIALGMYYNRPSAELIFLTRSDHNMLHHRGKHRSEDTRKKISEAHKNISDETRKKMSIAKQSMSDETKKKISIAKQGKLLSEEHRKKISEAKKGKTRSEETQKKISEAHKGKKFSEEHRRKLSEVWKGTHYYNNGKVNIRAKECPEGFVSGRLLIK